MDILRPSHAKRTGSRPSAFSIHISEWYSQGDGEVVGALEGSGMTDTPQSDDTEDVACWLTQIAAEAKGVIEDAAQKLAEVKMWAKTRSRRVLGSKGSWCKWWHRKEYPPAGRKAQKMYGLNERMTTLLRAVVSKENRADGGG